MNSSYYKNCIVPQCKSTTIKTPNKLFIYVPNNEQIRKKWLKLARRNDHSLSTDSRMYFCEDHFDLSKDMVNYMEYHIMGKVSQVRMKPGCVPSKFECQEDKRKRTCNSTERPYILKKQRIMTIRECTNEPEEVKKISTPNSTDVKGQLSPEKSCIPSLTLKDALHTSSNFQTVGENVPVILCKHTTDKSVQAFVTHKLRNKAVQTKITLIDFETFTNI